MGVIWSSEYVVITKSGSVYKIVFEKTDNSNARLIVLKGESSLNNCAVSGFGTAPVDILKFYNESNKEYKIPERQMKKLVGKSVLVTKGQSGGKTGTVKVVLKGDDIERIA